MATSLQHPKIEGRFRVNGKPRRVWLATDTELGMKNENGNYRLAGM